MADRRITEAPDATYDAARHLKVRVSLELWADQQGYTEPAPSLKHPDVGRRTPGDAPRSLIAEAVPREWPGDARFRDRIQYALAVAPPKHFAPGTLRVAIGFTTAAHLEAWRDFLALIAAQYTGHPVADIVTDSEKLADGVLVVHTDIP